MAHLQIPDPVDPELPVYFNVDGPVGAAPATNLREDVLLVQFAFKILSQSPRPTTPASLVKAASAVTLSGVADSATINAIRELQQVLRADRGPLQVVDGRVSPAKGGFGYGGSTVWSIVQLNSILQDRHVDVWPRIDKIPGCPPELTAMVMRIVAGK